MTDWDRETAEYTCGKCGAVLFAASTAYVHAYRGCKNDALLSAPRPTVFTALETGIVKKNAA